MNRTTKGCFLIAAPHLVDPNFRRTVVFMAEHNAEGGFGLVLNRPAKIGVARLWSALTKQEVCTPAPAFVGGPVQTSAVFVLHACEDLAGDTEPIVPGVWLGNDLDLLGKLLERERELREAGEEPAHYRLFCGYAGWGENQLEGELATGSWIVQPADAEHVLRAPSQTLWSRVLDRQGGVWRIFSRMPSDPELN